MRLIVLMLLIGLPLTVRGQWMPPKNPDPDAILNEARADADAEKYEDALAKHVWFHQHALEHEPALYGVRLSFALSDWVGLAKKYPPALAKLKDIRDAAKKEVVQVKKKNRKARELFHDVAAINRTLGEGADTASLFAKLHKEDEAFAKDVFNVALPALVQAKEYRLCGKYLDSEKTADREIEMFRQLKQLAQDNDGEIRKVQEDLAERHLTNHMATLVALLVINERRPEAEKVAAKAKQESQNDAFHAALNKALTGVVPEQDP